MSYILEALRNSDQQRQHGATPTLLTAHENAAARKPVAFLQYSLVAVLLVAAGIAIGWVRPWQGGPQAPAAAVVANSPTPNRIASQPVQMQADPGAGSGPATPAYKTAPGTQAAVVTGAVTQAAPETTKQALSAMAAAGTSEASGPVIAGVAKDTAAAIATAKTATGPVQGTATQEKAVMTLAGLPVAIQQEIPRMAISVHAYSGTPANRLVSINDQLLREGDALAPGLRLDEITEDGMIFSYKGYRFRTGTRGSGSGLSRP